MFPHCFGCGVGNPVLSFSLAARLYLSLARRAGVVGLKFVCFTHALGVESEQKTALGEAASQPNSLSER